MPKIEYQYAEDTHIVDEAPQVAYGEKAIEGLITPAPSLQVQEAIGVVPKIGHQIERVFEVPSVADVGMEVGPSQTCDLQWELQQMAGEVLASQFPIVAETEVKFYMRHTMRWLLEVKCWLL